MRIENLVRVAFLCFVGLNKNLTDEGATALNPSLLG